MTAPADAASAVVVSYQQSSARLRAQLAAYVTALWRSLGVYRAEQMREFAAQVVPVVDGAVGQMQATTAAYLAALAEVEGLSALPAATRALSVGSLRNGANPAEVYSRPFHLVWRQLASQPHVEGAVDKAIQSGLDRATQTALTDVQLAKVRTSQDVLTRSTNVTGYRRQLEGPHSCALCIVASTRRYHRAELMPVHPACDCTVVPLYGTEGSQALVSPEVLAAAHAAVAERFGVDSTAARKIDGALTDNGKPVLYRDVLIEHDHGELGRVLAVRGQHYTGPSAIH